MTKRTTKAAAKRSRDPKPLLECPLCGQEPSLIESHSAFFVSCNDTTPGTGGYCHHVEVIERTEAKAIALWRKLAGKR